MDTAAGPPLQFNRSFIGRGGQKILKVMEQYRNNFNEKLYRYMERLWNFRTLKRTFRE
jgi:hypothetical protein